ncbi:MAG: YesL family protein [Lachnospiraceae bacterium]|nr:YesL family protein [Candidatus Colinaster equi]
MFKFDGPIVNFFNKVADIIILNLLAIVCSIPIITIGASWTAMYYVTVKMVKNEESYIWKDYFKSFAQNFRQATCIWLINLVTLLVLGTNIYILVRGYIPGIPQFAYIITLISFVAVVIVMMFEYPILSHFANTVKNTIKNAMLLAVANLPYAILFTVLTLLPFILVFWASWGLKFLPVIVLVGLSGPAYLCSLGWKRIFGKLDSNADQGEGDEQEESQESE